MHILSALLLGIATNIDNLLIGMLLGLQKKKITWWQNAVIALGALLATLLCCMASESLLSAGRLPNIVGAALLVFLGVRALLEARRSGGGGETAVEGAGKTSAPGERMSMHDCLCLTVALGVNVVAAAFGAGMTGMGAWMVALFVAGFSFLSVGLGNAAGLRSGRLIVKERSLNVISAAAMILLGVVEMLV